MIRKPNPLHSIWTIIKEFNADMSSLIAGLVLITGIVFISLDLMLAGLVIWIVGRDLKMTLIREAEKEAYENSVDESDYEDPGPEDPPGAV